MDENLLENNTTESGSEQIDAGTSEMGSDSGEELNLDGGFDVGYDASGDALPDELVEGDASTEMDSTVVLYTYSEEQQQMDSQIIERLDNLNGTCTLLLFFLLFAWVDKKVRFFVKGIGYGKSD